MNVSKHSMSTVSNMRKWHKDDDDDVSICKNIGS